MKQVVAAQLRIQAVSHPSRVRGLKLLVGAAVNNGNLSHPSRVRGLKLEILGLPPFIHESRTLRGCVY